MPFQRKKLFWILHISGWSVFVLAKYFFFLRNRTDTTLLCLIIYTYFLGFLMTGLAFRPIFRRLRKSTDSQLQLYVSVGLLVLVSVAVWYYFDMFTSMPFWTAEYTASFFENLGVISFFRATFEYYLVSFGWTALYFGINYWIDWQEEQRRSAEAQRLAQKAQLQLLRYQLNPHFLFNSMNSIKSLIDENPVTAKEMITELADFLRYSLTDRDTTFRPIADEVQALRLYLSIEKKRFEEKLDCRVQVEPAVEDWPILSFLIHPFVDNGIKHGMKTSPLPLKLEIDIHHREATLVVRIRNSGHWIDKKSDRSIDGTGTGMENAQKRLMNAYGDNHRFEIQKFPEQVCIEIEIDGSNDPDERSNRTDEQ